MKRKYSQDGVIKFAIEIFGLSYTKASNMYNMNTEFKAYIDKYFDRLLKYKNELINLAKDDLNQFIEANKSNLVVANLLNSSKGSYKKSIKNNNESVI